MAAIEYNFDDAERDNAEPSTPLFKPEYFWAFATLMLFKLGGCEVIDLEHLEKFDAAKDSPQLLWDDQKKAFVMKLRDYEKPLIVVPPKKRLKRRRGLIKPKFMRN